MISNTSPETRLLNPAAWATSVLSAESRQDAWQKFANTLEQIGFENFSYVSEVPRFKLEFPAEEHIFGYLVSPEFERAMRDRPDAGANYSVANAASRDQIVSLDPVVDLNHPQTPEATCETIRIMMDLGFAGGWSIPIADRRKGTFSALMIDCSRDRSGQQQLIDEYTPYLKSSVVYFREGLEVRQLLESGKGSLLSQREADCMAWTAAGRSAKEIGELMGIAMTTVNEYIAHAVKKLGAANRTQASARAVLAGCAGRSL